MSQSWWENMKNCRGTHELVRGDLAKLGEDFLQFLVRQVFAKVLHIYVCELFHLRHVLPVLSLAATISDKSITKFLKQKNRALPSPPSPSPSPSWAQKSQQTPSSRAAAFHSPKNILSYTRPRWKISLIDIFQLKPS